MSDSGSVVTADHEENLATAKAVYILYILGWLLPIIAPIVGVILAYIHREESSPWLRTHYQFQIRTFWIGFLFFVISVVASYISLYLGWPLLLLTLIWSLVRCVKGLIAIFDSAPYVNPETWLW